MSTPEILLLTNVVPGSAHAGSVYLTDLLRSYPKGRIRIVAILESRDVPKPANTWGGHAVRYVLTPRQYGFSRFGPRMQALSTRAVHAVQRRAFRALGALPARAVNRWLGVELLWVCLDMPSTIYLARPLARALGVPLVATVWDDPERIERSLSLDPASMAALLADFGDAMRTARAVATASWSMRDEYRRLYGVESEVMIHGLPASSHLPVRDRLPRNGELCIVFAGSLYARDEWSAFIAALRSAKWRVAGRAVVVRVLTALAREQLPGVEPGDPVESLGWRDLDGSLRASAEADIGYLPYWFSAERRKMVRLCFPNKMSSYFAAGLPVFFHGPRESEPADFVTRFEAGVVCDSTQAEDILSSLERLVEPAFLARAAQGVAQARSSELNRGVFLERFARLVGVRRDELLDEIDG